MFQGFDPRVVDFMWGIRFNNEKAWFEAHKNEYLTYFYRPMQELCRQVYAVLAEENEDLDLTSRLTRIYRDARRLRGRGPYKDRLWFSIERPCDGEWSLEPTFWFELAPEARLDREPKPFEKLARSLNRQDTFLLEGTDYKRPKGSAPSKVLEPWYNKKGFLLTCDRPNEGELFAPGLADTLIAGYRFLLPFYRYFLSLSGDPDPRI